MLETTFQHGDGRLRLVDFMPIRKRKKKPHLLEHMSEMLTHVPHGLAAGMEREIGNDVAAAHRITRIATCLEGSVPVEITLKATFNYAREQATIERHVIGEQVVGAILSAGERFLVFLVRTLETVVGQPDTLSLEGDEQVLRVRATLHAGNGLVAALNYARTLTEARELLATLVHHDVDTDLVETLAYWQDWSASSRYTGTYQHAVLRSALALKLCTFEPTGAIVAAPTTSLPEDVGGVRNWDYRYTWLRDSAFTLGALGRLGYTGEARDYFHFLHDLQIKSGSDIKIMYGIRGESGSALDEQELSELSGYMDSRPVRIGNGAATQRQLDVYGELLDAAFSYVENQGFRTSDRHITPDRNLRELAEVIANYVSDHWQDLDRGIWEVLGDPHAFVYSRAMCWVALDRACQMAPRHGHAREERLWGETRQRVRADVIAHGYNDGLQSFVQYFGSNVFDAANLRLPLVSFLPWNDPKITSTVDTTKQALSGPRALVYRYRTADTPEHGDASAKSSGGLTGSASSNDGLPGKEGAFLACAFWLVDNLCYLGRVEEARERFEELLHFASPLGLFSEEVDTTTGAALGNYPQAFTHIGLINSAVTLQLAQEGMLTP